MKVETWLPKKKAFTIQCDDAPPLHGLFVLAGHRGAGKGVACTSLLRWYRKNKMADRIFWVSPTIGSNRQFLDELEVDDEDRYDTPNNEAIDVVIAAVKQEAQDLKDYKEAMKVYKKVHSTKQLTPDELLSADRWGFLDHHEAPTHRWNGRSPVIHLVIDDGMGSPLFSAGPRSKLVNLCIRHRHVGDGLGITVWLLVQSWSAHGSVPRSIRENCTCAALWWTPQEKQREKMAEELSDRRGPDVFLQAYEEACRDSEHDFLVVDFTKKTERYRKGWCGAPLPSPAG